ncbi:carbonic anhydrase 2 [Aplysia californica]|uniref:Carbonic anhydrase n=1 Tax=Aplysia californica TaxID=6500 RepID=A0ABM0JQ23_APLCA|nr:carbonic anhydrase 2 [Aplysia californica]
MLRILMLAGVVLGVSSSPQPANKPNLCHVISHHFDYDPNGHDGPAHWPELASCCGSTVRQSPRDLPLDSLPSQECDKPFNIQFHNSTDQTGLFYDNGHAPNMAINSASPTYVTGVPYAPEAKYILAGIHFHFSDGSKGGSEHALNGERYDGEMHMVHYKEEYGGVAESVLHEDGLMVIGVFLQGPKSIFAKLDHLSLSYKMPSSRQIWDRLKSLNRHQFGSPDESPVGPLNDLLKEVSNIHEVGKEFGVDVQVDVESLLPKSSDFLTYAGSLTTPPCSESVRWIVMADPVPVTQDALEALRALPAGGHGHGLIAHFSNARDLQNNQQPVETNFKC